MRNNSSLERYGGMGEKQWQSQHAQAWGNNKVIVQVGQQVPIYSHPVATSFKHKLEMTLHNN